MSTPSFGRLLRWLPLVCGLMCAEGVHAVQGEEFIAPPRYSLLDRFSVDHYSGEVAISVDTVAIGGERGLSHSVSARTNLFEYPGNRGFTDKFAAALRYKELGRDVVVKLGETAQNVLWVMSATALGASADFLVMRNGAYAFTGGRDYTSNFYYEAIGDTRHTLQVVGGSRVWTQPDGTQVFFGMAVSGAAGAGSSASKIVYPNGFTLNLHYDTGVTTNTGFQLKYVDVDDDPGLAPEKQGRVFPPGYVPSETQSAQAQWWSKNPKYVYGINRAFEYCNESTNAPCTLQHAWPKATFQWPGGMPRAIFIDQSVVTVENAAGGKALLRYEAFDAARLNYSPYNVIDGEIAGYHMAPRLVAYTAPGASQPAVQYIYENQIGDRPTGNGSTPYVITRAGATKTATGIRGSAGYHHNPGQWGEIFHVGAGISAGVSTVLPGTFQELTVDHELSIFSFEASYRNFPKVVTDYNGPNRRYEYDARGNVKRVEYLPVIDGQNAVYTAGYPATCANPKTCNKPLWIQDARGNRTDYSYHADSGQIATVTGPADANGIRPQIRYAYEPKYAFYKKNGNTVEQADTPLWLLTREATCRTSATSGNACAGGPLDEVVTAYDYGPQDGSPNNLFLRGLSVTAEVNGALQTRTTCYEYDIYGNRIGETLPKGTAGGCSALVPQQPGAYKYAKRYTPAGQLAGEISPDPDGNGTLGFKATRHIYATDGKLLRTETGVLAAWPDGTEIVPPENWNLTVLSSVHYQYDAYGRQIEARSRDSLGNVSHLVHTSYDARGNVDCKAQRMNLAATTATGACTPTTGPNGQDRITRYQYNSKDQVQVEWRAWGTPLQQKYAEYTFQNMLITSLKDANGNKTEQRYDGQGRLSRRVYPSKIQAGQLNESDYQEYRYDLNSNLAWERKRSGATFNYSYDNLNRRTAKLPATGRSVHYGYDLRGLQLRARFDTANGPGILNQYDGFGRVTQTTNTLGVSRALTYAYDANGNRTRLTHPDGVTFSYQFDGLDRVSGVGENTSTNNLLTIFYHPNGGRESLLRSGGAATYYDYDAAQRIDHLTQDLAGTTSDLILGFDFNPAGQIVRLSRSTDLYHYVGNDNKTGTYAVNGLNQYTSVNGQSFNYDANGNLTSDGVNSYVYDAENRLISVSGSASAALEYDPLGRLFQITMNGISRQFLYDGDALVAEYAPSGTTPLARYVHGDRIDELWVQYNGAAIGSSQRRYLHTDHQGSVIAHSDGSGNALNTLRYDGYGIADTANVGRFGYTGQIWIPEIGLYYYKARMYSPELGRFLQVDAVGYADQMNMYAYVNNDPINNIDPTGTTCTVNDGEAKCKVDDPGRLRKSEIEKIEKAYTKAVNKLLKNPDRKATITVKGKSVTTTAGTVAKGLIGAKVAPGDKNGSRASTAGGTLSGDRPTKSGGVEIQIHRPAISGSERALSRTFVHEGFHTVPEESGFQDLRDHDHEQFQKDHRGPYNNAAEELLKD